MECTTLDCPLALNHNGQERRLAYRSYLRIPENAVPEPSEVTSGAHIEWKLIESN